MTAVTQNKNALYEADDSGIVCAEPSTLSRFLNQLFLALDTASVRWCVLRKYEGFPTALLGRDVDILIHPNDLLPAIQAVRAIPHVSVTHLVPGACGVSLRADDLQLDFISSLSWQGQPYLEVDQVLSRATTWSRWRQLPIPDEVDKAIISLFQSYIAAGRVKEQYITEISGVCAKRGDEVITRLSPRIGRKIAAQLVSSIAAMDYNGAVKLLQSVRWRLLLRNLVRYPASCLRGLCGHQWQGIIKLFAPARVTTVALVGVDGAGKSTVLAEVEKALRSLGYSVEHRNFRPKILYARAPQEVGPYLHPHSIAPHSAFGSALRAIIWCVEYWVDLFLASRNGTEVQLYDRYFHDLLIDPARYRYGGPRWSVRMLGKIVAEPDLWVLLDAPPEVSRARKPEFDPAETIRQRSAYLAIIARRRLALVVDSTQPLTQVIAQVEAAILDLLKRRAAKTFAKHFKVQANFPIVAACGQHENTERQLS